MAACLTPPAVGGVAVIEVAGARARAVVQPLLRSRRGVDLDRMDPGEVRLCRWVDGNDTIDDVLVAVRLGAAGEAVVDVSLHGGRRIVERSLLMLKRGGARVVEPGQLLQRSWPNATAMDRVLLEPLLRARTRAVASWLVEMGGRLPIETEEIVRAVESGRRDEACSKLRALCTRAEKVGYLLNGVRVVLIGEPNVGKSTLANALGGRNESIVSEVPGTTRDWVEHPGAVEGIPMTFVDTAGVREANDSIEQEAVRRTHEQVKSADVLVRILDVSCPPTSADRQAVEGVGDQAPPEHLLVWNKDDLARHPAQVELAGRSGSACLFVSARTGQALDELRAALIEAVGLTGWRKRVTAPVSEGQLSVCRAVLSVLESGGGDLAEAVCRLDTEFGLRTPAEDRGGPGYNETGKKT